MVGQVLLAAERGESSVQRRASADMWSVGVINFELFANRRLFDVASTSDADVISQVIQLHIAIHPLIVYL